MIMAFFIGGIFGLVIPWALDRPIPMIPFLVSGGFLLVSCIFPQVMGIIYKPWMLMAEFLQRINTMILLAIIFYLVFTPWAMVLKIMGKDFMERKWDKTSSSYWKTSEPQPEKYMENTY